jgi:bifunctional UDP-N-acetylglucosamine pyrophosphorylase / glucosamine-1-phosphate N-acetyltransferase
LVDSFKEAGIAKPILVVGYKKELITDYFGDEVNYAIQDKQLGTGHAVMAAEEFFKGRSVPVLIAYGDMPLWSKKTIEEMFDRFESTDSKFVLATVKLSDKYPYGRIIRDKESGELVKIVEEKDCSPSQLRIEEKNPGLYLVESNWLFEALRKVDSNNAQNEYYLTDIIEIAVEEGLKIETIEIEDTKEAMGVNTGKDYQAVKKEI